MWRYSSQLVRKNVMLQRREFKARRSLPVTPFMKDVAGAPQEQSGYGVGKAIAFTVGATCTFFAGSAIYKYEEHSSSSRKVQNNKGRSIWPPSSYFNKGNQKAGAFRRQINEWWQQQSRGHRTFYGIFALNTIVLALWRVPRLAHIMPKYFCNSAASSSVSSLLLSTFSHASPVHFACNMTVLYSFSDSITTLIGPEHFVATYLSAGVIASLASHLHQAFRRTTVMSLGASGAIMGILAICSTVMPHAQLSILFLPQFTFSASAAIKALIAFDLVGLALRWSFIDHAAHLGGAFFGVWFAWSGHKYIAQSQQKVIEQWRRIRQ